MISCSARLLLPLTALALVRGGTAQCSPQWLPGVGAGPNGPVFALHAFDPDGTGPASPRVLAGGYFGLAGGGTSTHVAIYDQVANAWSPLGTGVDSTVLAVLRLPNGDLVAGGAFSLAGGVAANRIARWNGSAWSPIGAGPGGTVRALAVLPNGTLVAGGDFGIAQWNGSSWLPMGTGATFVGALTMANGQLVAGGTFAGEFRVEAWNGVSWSPLGPAANGDLRSLLALANGDLVAGGAFVAIGSVAATFVARWNGTTWSAMPGLLHSARALAQLPNGDVVAGGGLSPAGAVTSLISRWNGSVWAPLATGMDSAAYTLANLANGDLLAGGTFGTIGGTTSADVARLTTNCPAATAVVGSGCAGSAGPVLLTPDNLPWAGSTFRATASGLPALGVAVHVVGFTPLAIPLGNLLPQALAGCVLRAAPDFAAVLFPVAGTASAPITLPNTPTLGGMPLHQQVVPLELDAALTITAATSSNALRLTIGVL